MNYKIIIGIGIAIIAIVIIALTISSNLASSKIPNSQNTSISNNINLTESNPNNIPINQSSSQGKKLQLDLNDSVGIKVK